MDNKNSDILKKALMRFKSDIPNMLDIAAIESKTFFMESFTKQGWDDRSLNPWQPRKNNKDAGRGILIKTGDLSKSIKVFGRTTTSRTIGSTGLVYAKVHNFGLKSGRGNGFKMPRRQFIGISHKLTALIKRKIMKRIKMILLYR